jgi:hypothetical protein
MPWQPSLAYFFFIPLILLLFQQYFRDRNLKWTIIISIVVLFSYFINPYLGIIGTLFFGVIMLSILYGEGWKDFKIYLFGFIQSLLPGILYQLYVKLTDVRTDRVDMPTGLHEFVATFPSIFTSPFTPLKSFYESLGVDMINLQQHFEGMAYVGVSTSLIVLFFIALIIKNKKLLVITVEQRILVFSAFLFFILAIGFPFVFHPSLEKLLEIFKPLRQLRALGRMAWMVPFCINLVVFSMLYFFIKEKITNPRIKVLAYLVATCLILFTAYEGSFLHQEVSTNQKKGNTFLKEDLKNDSIIPHLEEALNSIEASKYSAIVPIPYFHVGSELFVTKSHTTYTAMLEVISFAYHTNLPLTACYLSRISVKESKKALQFFAPSMIEKEIEKDIKSDKPFLFFHSKSVPNLSNEELRLLKLGKIIYETDLISLIEVNPSQIWKTNNDEIAAWYTNYKNIYTQKDNMYYFGEVAPFYNSYNNIDNELGINGSGLIISDKRIYIFNQETDVNELKSGKYELSFWFDTSLNRMQATLILEKVNKKGDVISTTELYEAKRSFTIKDNWIRWQQDIVIEDGYLVRLYLKEPSNEPGLIIDDLMLLPEKSSVFIQNNEENWSWNNYPITMNY